MSLQRFAFCAVLGLLGCNTKAEAPARPEPAPPAEAAAAPRKTYGAPLGASPTATLADVLKAPEKFDGQRVTVEGAVRAACTRKGCWMELSEGADPSAPGCRVTFKDYGFFVPTDSAGSKARVDAQVETKVVKPEMVAHLESEGAKFAEKSADGSAREVRLVATGVEMWR
ncbi:MAG: DUF4920 domain-containing protein [Myxococcales bacterium]|nr:MAG: DUF4920 domain-containing protein [Myxococcales bacterium]